TLAQESLAARGADPGRVGVFANTIDVDAWIERADRLRAGRPPEDGVVVLSVARLAPEKGLDLLVRAVAAAQDDRLRLVLVGGGPKRAALGELAAALGVQARFTGDLPQEEVAREYAQADVFALLSRREPWGVVVNEAAASGLPLVLAEDVGAARDLLRDADNGFLVPREDVARAAEALRALAEDPELRRAMGARSRELVRGWGYDASVDAFVAAVRAAASK
ncbi:MAG: glycosyltransferase family 4 protein, partial [Actinobacteria bacterium]